MKTSTAPVHTAHTLDEALALRAAHSQALIIAGGTDLMVGVEVGVIDPPAWINIWGCDELRGVRVDDQGAVRLGALCTWTELIRDERVPQLVRDCAGTIGAAQIQNRGTVGGNIVNASPAGDSLPVWLALDATFELSSQRGTRHVSAQDFFQGYRAVDLAADELLVAVHVRPYGDDHVAYRKVGTRSAQAISKVAFAGRLRIDGGVVTQARVALGSVAPVPVRCQQLEDALLGGPVRADLAHLVDAAISPIDDVRSTARYRSRVARNIVRRWLLSLEDAG